MTRIAVLASGRGSNLRALLEAAAADNFGGKVVVVLSNVETAPALAIAREAGVEALFCDPAGKSRDAYDQEVAALLKGRGVDLVCLAGYMRLVGRGLLEAFPRRILNIHPSLLPSFPGLSAQKQALDHGVAVTGATVHLVDEGCDTGPIVLQEAVGVLQDDTEEALSARILEVEHRLYPAAVRKVLAGRWHVEGRRFLVDP